MKSKEKKQKSSGSFRKTKVKISRFFGLFRPSNLVIEAKYLGYEITTKTLAFIVVALVFFGFISGYLLHLQLQYILALILFFILCMPSVMIMTFKNHYEERRFNDIINYMEQLIYAFHKCGKIRPALQDVYGVSSGHIRYLVGRMMNIIDKDMTTTKLYEKAFALMQNEYDCTRLKILHDYLLSVEYNGGEHSVSLNIMLEDIRAWSERILIYQKERKSIQNRVLISIFFAMLSCGIMVNLIPSDYRDQIVIQLIYQIGTLGVMGLNILLYVFSCNKVSLTYLDNELDRKLTSRVRAQVKYIADWDYKNHFKSGVIKCIIVCPIIGVAFYVGYTWIAVAAMCLMLFLMLHDYVYRNQCQKSLVKEIKKTFPVWLRALVLYLQMDNVHVAIRDSYKNCPEIMRPELKNFIEAISNDPITIRPYMNFLKTYDVPELKLAVHYLYSVATFGSDDMLAQLEYLIEQNSKLEIEEERLRNEDSLAGFSLAILAPMIVAVMKLMLDLVLFLGIFMGYLESSGAL